MPSLPAFRLMFHPVPGAPVLCFSEHHADPLPGVIIRLLSSDRANVRVFGDPPAVPFNDETWTNVRVYPASTDVDALPPDGRFCQAAAQVITIEELRIAEPGVDRPKDPTDEGVEELTAGLPANPPSGTETTTTSQSSSGEASSQTQPVAKEAGGEQVPAGSSITPPSSESSTSAAG